MRLKPLLVGEVNPHESDPQYALYPEPKNSAGQACQFGMIAHERIAAGAQ